MRFTRLRSAILAMALPSAGFLACTSPQAASAQTETTGALSGSVVDQTGAAVPSATVIVTESATNAQQTMQTNGEGRFTVGLLKPGLYKVTASASGLQSDTVQVSVVIGLTVPLDVKVSPKGDKTVVEVVATEAPLLHTEDAQLSSEFTQEQIQNLPNPGNDITFVAQTAPGSVMNTQSGYGNFSSFGLPGTANTYTVNGGYYNDPFLNVNNSGATNLTLGANDISTVTVTSNAYNASFGGLGGAQVSEISRSGTNTFHGNAAYWWNGRVMNANDYFNNNAGNARPFDNVNQWAASIGGPIRRDKTFFFANYEGLRVVLPTRATIYAPDASYQSKVLANLTKNGLSSEIPIYKNIFGLYDNAPGYSSAAVSTPDSSSDGYGTVTFNGTSGNFTHEYLFNGRIDHTFSERDHLFGHATIDKGVQATYTSLLNPLFDALSPQPSYEGQLGEQHIFSPTISNSFEFSTIYYRAVFTNTNEAASAQQVPFTLIFADQDLAGNGSGAFPGGLNIVWPQGRDVTGYNFQDDVSWTRGKHTVSFGWTMRRDDLTDFSPSEYTLSPEAYTTNGSFEQGYVDLWFEQFPTRTTQPVALYTMGWYLQDQWKVFPNFTVTYGLRMEHNSDPVCRTNCFARLYSDFVNLSASTSTPYNQLITSGHETALKKMQPLGYEPRVGFAYLPFGPDSKTTIRAGFGMFADAFPGQIADDFLNNAPSNVPFTIYGPAFGGGKNALVPGAPNSAESIASASDKAFVSGFSAGVNNATLSTLNGFAPPNISNARQTIDNPTYEEWSLAVEQQVSKADSFSVMYVGNRTYHQPELNNGVNAYNSGKAPGFSELSTSAPPNPNFASVTEVSSSSVGNFNGVVAFWQHRARDLTVNLNYQYSHALDEISNGGFDGFSGNSVYPDDPFDLSKNYGNADYDTRHYVSANYLYMMPHYRGPKVLVDNWQVSGTVFHSTGLPLSIVDTATAAGISNYGGPLYARQVAPLSKTHCGGKSATVTTGNGTACSFASDYASATNFGGSGRNQIFGPNYTDSDLSVMKGFTMPHWETGKLRVGAQFFNLFNHPNFGQPGNDVGTANFGKITGTVNTPTSILGSFLGGDASPRLVQLTAKFDF